MSFQFRRATRQTVVTATFAAATLALIVAVPLLAVFTTSPIGACIVVPLLAWGMIVTVLFLWESS